MTNSKLSDHPIFTKYSLEWDLATTLKCTKRIVFPQKNLMGRTLLFQFHTSAVRFGDSGIQYNIRVSSFVFVFVLGSTTCVQIGVGSIIDSVWNQELPLTLNRMQYIMSSWQDEWNDAGANKLCSMMPVLGDWQSSYRRVYPVAPILVVVSWRIVLFWLIAIHLSVSITFWWDVLTYRDESSPWFRRFPMFTDYH